MHDECPLLLILSLVSPFSIFSATFPGHGNGEQPHPEGGGGRGGVRVRAGRRGEQILGFRFGTAAWYMFSRRRGITRRREGRPIYAPRAYASVGRTFM